MTMGEFVLNLVMCLLLVTVAVWCSIIYRRLRTVERERQELIGLVEELRTASDKAEGAARQLRDAGSDALRVFREEEQDAQRRCEELGRLVGAATRVSQRLESTMAEGLGALAEARTRAELAETTPSRKPRRAAASRGRRAAEPLSVVGAAA
jgi:biopolymer transport protein ExbB/TolQ